MSGRELRRRSRLRVVLAAVPLAVLLLAPVPGPASAQTAGDACEGKLTGAGRRAELSFSCNFSVRGLEIFSNKDATIRGDFKGEEGQGREGFACFQPVLQGPSGEQGGDSFGEQPAVCEGGLSAGNTATATLVARDDVCDPLALRVTASGRGEDTFIVRIQGCGRDDDHDARPDEDGGTRPDEDEDEDEDEGEIPRGGVDSGGGGRAPADGPGTSLLAAAGLILAPPAQTAGNACEGKLTGEGRQAELSFSCNFNVNGLMIFSNKDARLGGDFKGEEGQGREGFVCVQPVLKGPPGEQGGDSFGEASALCEGNLSAGNTATGTLIARDDVCDPLALRVGAFSAVAREDEFIVRIQGCRPAADDGPRPDEDGGGTRPDEDEGQVPRGGVDSGGGGGAPADGTGTGLLVAAGLISAAALGLRTARRERSK